EADPSTGSAAYPSPFALTVREGVAYIAGCPVGLDDSWRTPQGRRFGGPYLSERSPGPAAAGQSPTDEERRRRHPTRSAPRRTRRRPDRAPRHRPARISRPAHPGTAHRRALPEAAAALPTASEGSPRPGARERAPPRHALLSRDAPGRARPHRRGSRALAADGSATPRAGHAAGRVPHLLRGGAHAAPG